MQNCRSSAALAVAFLIALCASACGGGGESAPPPVVVAPPPPPPPPAGTLVGSAGGTVTGPNGASVVIPPGALSSEIRILIEQSAVGAPALPGGFTVAGLTYSLTPHGTAFAVPVTLTLPFDPALVPAGSVPVIFKTINAQTQWQEISVVTLSANTVSADVTSFSFAQVLSTPAVAGRRVERQWFFAQYLGDGLTKEPVDEDISIGGVLSEVRDFGSTPFDSALTLMDGSTRDEDNIANGAIGSSEDGQRFYLAAEAPAGNANLADHPVGSSARLRQVQSFVKRASDATLRVNIPRVFMDVHDRNAALGRICPEHHEDGLRCPLIHASLSFVFMAFNTANPDIQLIGSLSGSAQVEGYAENWNSHAFTDAPSDVPFWTVEDFNFDITSEVINGAAESHVVMTLANTHSYPIDLSSIEVGRVFHVTIDATAFAYNLISGAPSEFATSSGAYFMEAPGVGGPTLTATGLDPVDNPPGLILPTSAPLLVRSCVPGPGPNANAGTIQFAQADYSIGESSQTPVIEVTRTGGSVGAVSATFRTSDGTAVDGTDYSAVASSVLFADGDDEPRYIAVRPIEDDVGGEADKTVNLTLSQPGGCAALGPRTTSVLTIRDDDPPPPPPTFTVGGTVSGLAGTGLVLQDLHFLPITPGNGPFTTPSPTRVGAPFAVTVLTQPTNPVQVCSVVNGSGTMPNSPVTNIQVNCVTQVASGALDPSFGGTGKVSSAFGGDDTRMLLQPDGKILMVGGNAGTGANFLVARYDTDGSLDESFGGTGTGFVTTDIAGGTDEAAGVALQSDGRIIVVGSARVGSNDNFAVVRYTANGVLDPTFGTLGKVTTDFGGGHDQAFAVTVQPDDRIVVVGDAIMPAPGNTDFAVARYTSSGAPDTTFDGDGRLTADIGGGVDIAQSVLLQGNQGAILVSGVLTLGGSPSLEHGGIARFTASGALDTSFGTGGKRTFPSLSVSEGLALQADGRILMAGHRTVSGARNFALTRLEANGATDGSFGTAGVATAAFSTQGDFGRAVAVHPDGRIFVAGQASNASNPDFGLACFTSGGALDNTFDSDGRLTVDFFGSFDGAETVAIQADGRLLLGGFAGNGNRTNYALARIAP